MTEPNGIESSRVESRANLDSTSAVATQASAVKLQQKWE